MWSTLTWSMLNQILHTAVRKGSYTRQCVVLFRSYLLEERRAPSLSQRYRLRSFIEIEEG